MAKRIVLTLVALLIVIGLLGGTKFLQIRRMMDQAAAFVPPPATVTAAQVRVESWETRLSAVGSLAAVQGVTVAAEMPGKVARIAFESGEKVEAGALLIQQDISTETAQLPGAEAAAEVARINLERAERLLAEQFISRSEYDAAVVNYRRALSEADAIRAAIAKKTVRAPFAGHLGIRLVNLGQTLREGDPVVSLQTLDPIYVDFLLPQQRAAVAVPGLTVRVTSDATPDQVIEGRIIAANPEVDADTRNLRLRALLPNPSERLRPGMFVTAEIPLPDSRQVLVAPSTAILSAPYGDSVFVVEEQPSEEEGTQKRVARQQFVRLGERRGDFVAILSGVKEGEWVVTTGIFKLRNGQAVVVDNTLSPEFHIDPRPENR